LRFGLSTTFQVPGRLGGGFGTGVAVAVGTMTGVGVRVGGLFEAASADDVPLTSITIIKPMLKSEAPMSDNLSRKEFSKFI
jgi:hypothetical protein